MKEPRIRVGHLWVVVILLTVALLYVLTLNLWGLRPWGKTIDYARFGTWSNAISGIGTTAAVIVALAAQYWQRTSQRATEAAQLLQEEVAVFQWLTSKEIRDANDKLVGRVWDVKIQNSTVAPIYKWKVVLGAGMDDVCNYLKRPLLPGENFFNVPSLDNTEPIKAPETTLIFEGHSGRVWTRTARGTIQQTDGKSLACTHAAGSVQQVS
ncbi:MAG: hypothetical protein ACREBG_18480 [Pyrinomonadaceae bacterium]